MPRKSTHDEWLDGDTPQAIRTRQTAELYERLRLERCAAHKDEVPEDFEQWARFMVIDHMMRTNGDCQPRNPHSARSRIGRMQFNYDGEVRQAA